MTIGKRQIVRDGSIAHNLLIHATQSQTNGITDMYKRFGTYCKAFTTTMMHPSGVKVSMMNSNNVRIHHSIKWINTTPMIISDDHRKASNSEGW